MPDKDGGMIFPGMKTPSKKRCIVDINRLGEYVTASTGYTNRKERNTMLTYGLQITDHLYRCRYIFQTLNLRF